MNSDTLSDLAALIYALDKAAEAVGLSLSGDLEVVDPTDLRTLGTLTFDIDNESTFA